MALKQPNTICKNRDCTKGEDGGRKHYYACRYCAHSENWRAVACSWECYLAYSEQVIEARRKDEPVDMLPERTDMSHDEVVELMNAPTEEVVAETMEELAEEMAEHPSMGFGEIVDSINEELDATHKRRSKKHYKEG